MATPYGVLAGVVLWGLHLGATQGVFAVLIARAAPQNRKVTAFGVFNFFSGLAMLASGLMAGMLWQYAGAQASFAGGAFFLRRSVCWCFGLHGPKKRTCKKTVWQAKRFCMKEVNGAPGRI